MYNRTGENFLGFKSPEALRNYLKRFASMNQLKINYDNIFKKNCISKALILCKISGVTERYYDKLNNSICIVKGFGKDTLVVLSKKNIKLPYKHKAQNPLFTYQGVVKLKTGVYWKYSIPRANCYKRNLCGVAYSVGIKPKVFNECTKVMSADGEYLYLQIVEYSKRTTVSKNIISIHKSIREARLQVETIIELLKQKGAIVDPLVYRESFEGELFSEISTSPMTVEKVDDFL